MAVLKTSFQPLHNVRETLRPKACCTVGGPDPPSSYNYLESANDLPTPFSSEDYFKLSPPEKQQALPARGIKALLREAEALSCEAKALIV